MLGQQSNNSHVKRMKLDPYVIPYIKIDSKRLKDLNVRNKYIKLIEENIEVNLSLGNGFLDLSPKAQATKEKIN